MENFIRSNPQLPVKNLQNTLAYYRNELGFYDEWTFGDKDGGIRRDSMMLLFTEDPEFTNHLNNETHRLPLMWFVNGIDSILFELKEKEIKIIDELRSHPYGLREFAFIDINGYYIRVAERMDPGDNASS